MFSVVRKFFLLPSLNLDSAVTFGVCFTFLKSNVIHLISKVLCEYQVTLCLPGHLLDSFARSALWDSGLDYLHGTGHGVGSFLNVHEGPCGISYKTFSDEPLEAGMIVTDGRCPSCTGHILFSYFTENW